MEGNHVATFYGAHCCAGSHAECTDRVSYLAAPTQGTSNWGNTPNSDLCHGPDPIYRGQLVSLVQEVDEDLPLPLERVEDTEVLTLSEAIRLAFEASPDLVSASEQIAVADASLARARADFYPRLGISEQYGVSNNPVTAFMFQLNQAQLNPFFAT